MAETENPMAALDGADASELAGMVAKLSDEQIKEGMADADNRKRVLDEIFKRMAEHAEPAKIKDLDAVVHFEITDAPGGGSDVYEAVFSGGEVKVSSDPTSDDPKATISAAPVNFLKLVTGQDSGPAMFMTGKLKIKGDLMFTSQMTSFFRIPSGS